MKVKKVLVRIEKLRVSVIENGLYIIIEILVFIFNPREEGERVLNGNDIVLSSF